MNLTKTSNYKQLNPSQSCLTDNTHTTGQFGLEAESLTAIPNSLELDNDAILQNLQQVQSDNDLPADEELLCIEETVPLLGEEEVVNFS